MDVIDAINLVLDMLNDGTPLNHSKLFDKVREYLPTVSKTTYQKALKNMEAEGRIKKVYENQTSNRYTILKKSSGHVHKALWQRYEFAVEGSTNLVNEMNKILTYSDKEKKNFLKNNQKLLNLLANLDITMTYQKNILLDIQTGHFQTKPYSKSELIKLRNYSNTIDKNKTKFYDLLLKFDPQYYLTVVNFMQGAINDELMYKLKVHKIKESKTT